jgi:hypothetical protein
MNRHERRKLGAMEVKMVDVNKLTGRACCFNGCGKIFDFKDGGMPKGWQSILMFGDPQPVLHLMEIRDWKRDGVLCPEHAGSVQDLLFQLSSVATMPSEGSA